VSDKVGAFDREEGVRMAQDSINEERLMAAMAHAAVAILGPGIIVGVFVWLTQKEKAPYASRHGLQAAIFQTIGIIIAVVLWTIWGIFYALTWIPLIQEPAQLESAPPPIFWIGLGSMAIPFLVMLAWIAYGLWGAVQCLRGRDFAYIFIGRFLPEA
jgi:uncharacterized Tic20 family protein